MERNGDVFFFFLFPGPLFARRTAAVSGQTNLEIKMVSPGAHRNVLRLYKQWRAVTH